MRSLRRLILPASALALAAGAPGAHAQAATGGAQAGGGPVTLFTSPQGMVGWKKTFTGTVARRDRGRTVAIERYDQLSRQWSPVAGATAASDRTFTATWKPDRAGYARFRARVQRTGARTAVAAPEVAATVFRPEKATWYGPGFYGNKTACGQTMTRTLLGVAHKTLKCGTRVQFAYRGRTITVPVVDRGPYANHASWDLTSAAAERIGFAGSETIGVLPQTAASR